MSDVENEACVWCGQPAIDRCAICKGAVCPPHRWASVPSVCVACLAERRDRQTARVWLPLWGAVSLVTGVSIALGGVGWWGLFCLGSQSLCLIGLLQHRRRWRARRDTLPRARVVTRLKSGDADPSEEDMQMQSQGDP